MSADRLSFDFLDKASSKTFSKQKSSLLLIAFILFAWVFWIGKIPYQEEIRNTGFDLYQIMMPRERVSAPVVIVDIDEESLKTLGQWPWPRTLLAELVDKVGSYGPAAIGIDLLLPESDRTNPCTLLSGVKNVVPALVVQVCAGQSNDEIFAQSIARNPVAVGVAGLNEGEATPLKLAPVVINGEDPIASVRQFSSAITNIAALHNAAAGWGLVSADIERGVIRQVQMIAAIGDQYVPSLTAEMIRLVVGSPVVELYGDEHGVAGIALGDLWLDTTPGGAMYVNYTRHEPARFISARDLLEGRVDPQELRSRFVLIGFTGLGLVDYVATPLGDRLPGVEIHAQMLENIFDGTTLTRPDWAKPLELGLLVVMSLLVIYLIPRFRILIQTPLFFSSLALVLLSGAWLFSENRQLIDVLTPSIAAAILYFALLGDAIFRGEGVIDDLESKVLERTKTMMELQDVAMEAMGALAESRDPETGNHIRRTQNYVRVLAEQISTRDKYRHQLSPSVITHLYKTAPLHDIGKVGVPDHILMKPGKLTDEEFVIMKRHPEYGLRAIEAAERKMTEPSEFLRYAKEIIYGHHEKWDGSGYPQRLKGEEIPLSARLMAIADVYDALICRRCYKPPFPHEKAVGIIVEGRGSHFDPEFVDAFLEVSDKFYEIALQYEDKEEDFAEMKAELETAVNQA